MSTVILYNPVSGKGKGRAAVDGLLKKEEYAGATVVDVTEVSDYSPILSPLGKDDRVILCGGDGTLNRFINDSDCVSGEYDFLFCAAGSGNDFVRDVGRRPEDGPFSVREYIKNLPVIRVAGMERYFINGVGYGLDGYCCECVNSRPDGKSGNYLVAALKGLLWDYVPTKAEVIVDGESYSYENVWLAPSMYGKYFGGGFKAAPNQDRFSTEGKVQLVMMYCPSRLKCLTVLPKVMKGTHLSHTEMITVHEAHEITVRFDRPVALQIDGESVPGISEYTVLSAAIRK